MSLAILEGLWRLLQLGGRLLGRTAGDKTRLSATCALTVLALAANGPAVGNNFLLHACYGHSDQFLLRIGNGSLAGLADMAEIIKEIPPEHGPVTSFYPDFRILYLLSGRQIVYPPLDTCDTPAEIEFFMEHMSPTPSYYIVVGDEDEIFNDALLDQLAKPSAFHLLHTQHHCRLYQRMTTPTHPDAGEATEPASK